MHHSGACIHHSPGSGRDRLDPSCQPATGGSNGEVTKGTDHKQQTKSVAYESRHTNHRSAQEDDQAVEQLPSGQFASSQLLLGATDDANADPSDDKGPQRADDDEDRKGPEEANLSGHDGERNDLCGNEYQCAEEEHRLQNNRSSVIPEQRVDLGQRRPRGSEPVLSFGGEHDPFR